MKKQTQKELLAVVKRNYDEIADQYNETRKKHLQPLWNNLIKIAKEVKEGDKVLDVGCGNGRLLEAFLGRGISYLGIDKNEKLLSSAKKNYPDRVFSVGNILTLGEIPQINFDHVFSIAVMHHLPGKDLRVQAVKQMKNKINNNGRIIITVWNIWGQKKFRKLIYKYFLLRLIKKNKMDFGDVLFSWKSSQGDKISQRYYHAFRKG
ncbi:MAG: class I SAM-dependent methyltransferase, partial [Patescibacteria group bacterium]|nr:class I SAM-dependent methyltransferase [Patescibacteria group bacterium]